MKKTNPGQDKSVSLEVGSSIDDLTSLKLTGLAIDIDLSSDTNIRTIFANGAMTAAVFLGYTYNITDSADTTTGPDIENYLQTPGNLVWKSGSNQDSAVSLTDSTDKGGLGWTVSYSDNGYHHDTQVDVILTAVEPISPPGITGISGCVNMYLMPPENNKDSSDTPIFAS